MVYRMNCVIVQPFFDSMFENLSEFGGNEIRLFYLFHDSENTYACDSTVQPPNKWTNVSASFQHKPTIHIPATSRVPARNNVLCLQGIFSYNVQVEGLVCQGATPIDPHLKIQ